MTRIFCAVFLAAAFPLSAVAQSADLAALVREAQAQVGTEIAPGATIAGVSLDGQQFNYRFHFDAARGARVDGGFPAQFAEVLGAGLCQQPPLNAFIRGGGVANVIIQDAAGSTLHTRTVNRC